ncbi:MAG: STAS domain-containing protein [Pseudooceanicola sp.]|nr:STAS domain-containing protein [Pseudooceanicola sp.]
MILSSNETTGAQVVTVTSQRIDAAVAIQFKEDMRSATEGGSGRVILDLSGVIFIDSSGLGAVVAAMKQLNGVRKLDLAGLTSNVDKVFRLTRMDTVFRIYPSLDDALAVERS